MSLLDSFGNYLVQSEIDAGVRDPVTKDFYDPVAGAQSGYFGPDVSSQSVLDDLSSARTANTKLSSRSGSGSGSGSGIVSSPVLPEYINAEFAKHYGMDVATAYQEALANTAHQREVKDLQAAGLNPVLAARYGGASGVSGASVLQSSSRSGSGSSDSGSSVSKFIAGAGLLAGVVAGIATKNPGVTSAVTSAAKTFSSLFE